MKFGTFPVGCTTLVAALLTAAAMAQDLPQRAAALQLEEDAPAPAVQVFEVQLAEPVPVFGGGPVAPLAPPAEPPRAVAADGTLVPASGETAAVDAVRVQWTDSSQIVGEIAANTPLLLKSRFGEMKLTFEDIVRIDSAVDDGQWRVTLPSGDRLTGELKLSGIKMKTSWGEVQLDDKKIASLEAGKLHTQQFAVARRSPDGRTTSVAYRERNVFAPLYPGTAGESGPGYPSASPYAPTPTYPTPAFNAPDFAPTAPPSARAIPRPR
jgi:hypothetical protein